MPTGDRGGLKAAFTSFKPEADKEAERKLLGRTVDEPREPADLPTVTQIYEVATTQPHVVGGLTPRPLLQREAVRQLSFRCPVSLAAELRRKAAFNQLEHQEIIVEGIKRVLAELSEPPPGWQG
ncbi:MAG: hypothetical protein L0338_31760 [Acidobacteria bacterium]|nr:hypothetical protein [Acidobacteriota bacterium]